MRDPVAHVRGLLIANAVMAVGGFVLAVVFAAAGYLTSALIMGAAVAFTVTSWGKMWNLYRRIKELEPPRR